MSEKKNNNFKEINVERLNIVESDGTLRMALFNKDNCPEPFKVDGKPVERQGMKRAGILFYNDEGTECGGLIFGGKRNENGDYEAQVGLSMDQFEQDEVITLNYIDSNGDKSYGLTISERPDIPMYELVKKHEKILEMDQKERNRYIQELMEKGEIGGSRIFVGRNKKGDSLINISDNKGRPKIKMTVDAAGNPKMEMLDDNGNVIYSLPPDQDTK